MNKWISQSTGLESKEQLKSHRNDRWRGLLLKNNLDLLRALWWTPTEQALELTLWNEADVEYEQRKVKLKADIDRLKQADKEKYLTEIGMGKDENIDTWLNIKE
uniref:Uncharacterized protein n=1 Tax=viral metagenome TaxID=1070528 RepID=A0A6M3K0Y5_9ZZZZ